MKPKSRKNLGNLIFFVALFVVFFTPLGMPVKVFMTRLLSFSPGIESKETLRHLEDYNWQLSESTGDPHNFLSEKNEVVLVNFWATWCPPCIAEMPELQELYNDYGDRVSFLFVALDEREKVEKFLKEKSYRLPVYFQISAAPDLLESASIPATYVLDKKGQIHIAKTGAARWNSEKVRSLLDSLLKS